MIRASSTVRINWPRINELSRAAVTSLEQTAEALHTDVVQAQVIPFDTGNLQNESFWVLKGVLLQCKRATVGRQRRLK